MACGAVAGLALPPLGWWPLFAAAMMVAQLLLRGLEGWRPGTVFVSGLAVGLGYFLVALHWIGFAFFVDGNAYAWMMPFAVGGLCLLMASYWGLAFVAARGLLGVGVPLFAGLPLALMVAEGLRGFLFSGFPWAAPGLIADSMGPLEQAAAVVGMPGLTFWLFLWVFLPLEFHRFCGNFRPESVLLVVLALTFPAFWLAGSIKLVQNPTQLSSVVTARLVQPNIAQSDKWRDENARSIFATLMRLSTTPSAQAPAVIVWPESSVPFLLDESSEARQQIAEALRPGQTLLAGAVRREQGLAGPESDPYFTSVLVIDSDGAVKDAYDKWRLVPGGEFLPLAWLLEPLGFRRLVTLPGSFTPGSGPRTIAVAGLGGVAMLVCYEAIFPDHLVDAANRPDVIVNVTNDGWFGLSTGPYQHLAHVRMRAIEQGLPVLRAANTGISAVIDPLGRYVAKSTLGTETVVEAGLPHALPATVFALYGVAFAYASSILVVAAIWLVCRKFERFADR